ncbi:hypothetical protein RHGRI_010116 [Rhododendron griersonianum]|uniref:Uncharacterized protein n=1 Tax=Rhododendron griersonianum TaxID=479676 RepID=A0AAV6KHW0_9ERIC|nr:hypothetical protein RHGRI_010116 [Rhododendron griersonianum]
MSSALVRSTTLRFRRPPEGYEPLDQSRSRGASYYPYQGRITRSRRKRRKIFLKTYKLASVNSSAGQSSCASSKLTDTVAVKVKKIAASVVSFIRLNSLRSRNNKSAICSSYPSGVHKSGV